MMISLKNIKKGFNGRIVLNDFSLEISDGTFTSIVGKSGSGKTTLLNIMGLIEKPDGGTVSIDGKIYLSEKDKLMFYRYDIGFLFQNFALIDEETVEKNLKIALAYKKNIAYKSVISDVLTHVGLTGMEKKKVYQLSGGEQQRVALARILIKDTKYIFADEPTGNLDSQNRDIVLDTLQALNENGKTIVLVTHDTDLAKTATKIVEL
jgi:putative ABC transport system ATP-binding protein